MLTIHIGEKDHTWWCTGTRPGSVLRGYAWWYFGVHICCLNSNHSLLYYLAGLLVHIFTELDWNRTAHSLFFLMLNIFTNSLVGDKLSLTIWDSNKMCPVLKRFLVCAGLLLLWQGGIPFSLLGGLTCSLRLFNSFPDLCPLVDNHTSGLRWVSDRRLFWWAIRCLLRSPSPPPIPSVLEVLGTGEDWKEF